MSQNNSLSNVQWYVARTRNGHELSIRSKLDSIGVKNFIPSTTRKVSRFGKTCTIEVPVVSNLVFIKATKSEALSLPNGYGLQMWYLTDRVTNRLLLIPEKQMEDFMRVYELDPESVISSDEKITVGDRVRVIKGGLAGIEGNVVSLSNRTYVVVSLSLSETSTSNNDAIRNALIMAKVKVPKSCLKVID